MIQASRQQQGDLGVEGLCAMAGVSRAGYYRNWRIRAPREEETEVRDAIQRLSLANRRLGYRRITALLRRDGLAVNHKRVERLRRSDNLLCLSYCLIQECCRQHAGCLIAMFPLPHLIRQLRITPDP